MKCLYYLSPSLDSAHTISDDLHAAGVKDWCIHVISKDEAGLRKQHIHSSNYVETLDFLRSGIMGASTGFIIGIGLAMLLGWLQPFGSNVPAIAYAGVVFATTLFGAWEGGLIGVGNENRKLAPFHQDIESGKYLFLIYARKGMGETIKAMMRDRHPQSQHVATDEHFMSPFSVLRRPEHGPPLTGG